jgi:hypothetical protein
MSCEGHGSTRITLPARAVQVLEEPSNPTLSSEQSHFKLRLAQKEWRKLIIDLTHGFKYPLLPSQQDDLVLIRRDEAIKYKNKLDHELLDLFLALNSFFCKHEVIQGKK